ncbi:apolipoprotein N-acyltransferase [Rhodoferax sp.]|uniref:apolipoprotein N-acyltransferase n=1 Tax=Rhodoferax sp. TaxID=50421 RepID=UPI002725AE9C|nr:apolipoprotein N-acyltransferase [Rhodoferax sp.]MDO9194940.1 apolipoprotein N-acyltransferase [Rhodoferax sp.]
MTPVNAASRLSLVQVALALTAGVAHAASMAWPLSIEVPALGLLGLHPAQPVWWLQLLALGLLAGLLRNCQHWRPAALAGWLFATAWLTGTFWWTFVALHTYGGLPAVLAVLAVLALAALLALYYAAICGLFVALAPVNRAWAAIVFAALWLIAELARGVWLTGFGWGASGYAHVDGPLAGFAPWLGMYGLCLLSAWLAMTLAQLIRPAQACGTWRERAFGLPAVLLLLTLPAVYRMEQPDMSRSVGTVAVTLLQGNIPQDEKFETGTGVPQALQWYAAQLRDSRTSLVIAPETAIPVLPQQLPPGYWDALQQRFATGEQAALIGMPLGSYQEGYTNSAVGFKPGQALPWRYDKHHLVPFGEFIPPFFKWFTAMMNIPLGDFNRGGLRQPPFEWQGQRLSPNICYEDLFGEELGQRFIDPAQDPTIFVNISNLAWYGNSLAMDQHLQIARMRAKEFERPFVLATNTGLTAIVDHRGGIVAALARDTRAVLVGEVEGRTGVTPYGWWVARFGLWPFWLGALALVLLAVRRSLRKR